MIGKNNNALCALFNLFALFIVTESIAMDSPLVFQELRNAKQSENVFVKTQDGKVEAVERRNINQMKVLSVLLEHQKGKNSKNNPIDAFMVTAKELELLNNALNAANRNEFGKFYEELSKGLGIGTVGEGDLRLLINAAQRVEATGLSALCSSYFLPPDMQKLLIPTFIQPSIDCLKNIIIKKHSQSRRVNLVGHSGAVRSAIFSPAGTQIVSGSDGSQNNLILWDVVTGKQIHIFVGHRTGVRRVAFSFDGKKIVSCSNGSQNNLIIWDASNGEKIHNFIGHNANVYSVAFSPDGSKIVSGGDGNQNNLMIWDVLTGQLIHNLIGHHGGISSIVFSPDGSKIVTGSGGKKDNLMLWDVVTGKRLHNFAGHSGTVNAVAFNPDASKIVAGSVGSENNLMIWDVVTGEQTHNLIGHSGYVHSVAFSPDGRTVVSGSWEKKNNILIWDVITGKQIHNLVGHDNNVRRVAFSPDGTQIVSGSDGNENNLMIWDVVEGKQIHSLVGHNNDVYSVAYSSDGNKIVSGSASNIEKLILWTLFTDQEVAVLNNLNNCTVEQARLLDKLCVASEQGIVVKLTEADALIFSSLPQIVQVLLQKNVVVPLQKKLPARRVQIRRRVKPLRTEQQTSEQQELARKKEEIRRSLTHPKFNDKKLLAEHIQVLKSIYTLGHDYHEAFNEVLKEMGY